MGEFVIDKSDDWNFGERWVLEERIDTINRDDPHGRTLTKSAFIRSLVERELGEDGDE